MSRIEDQVCNIIQERAKVGLNKYGTTVLREDYTFLDWLRMLQEELLDGAIYIERVIDKMKRNGETDNEA